MLRLLFAILIVAAGCSSANDPGASNPGASETSSSQASTTAPVIHAAPSSSVIASTADLESSTTTEPAAPPMRTGAEALADSGFESLQGLRVGAIVNQTSVVDDRRFVDLLADAPDIDLVRLFAPEHGSDGSLAAREVALLVQQEQWLPGLDQLRLRVIPVEDWARDQTWQDLEQEWIAPSPRLPTADSALLYNGMVLLAGTSISDGSGTPTPFGLAGAPWIESSTELLASLESADLPGVGIEAAEFTPVAIEGVSPDPLHQGLMLNGIRFVVTDPQTIDPIAVAIEVLVVFQRLAPAGTSVIVDPASFDIVTGSSELRSRIERGDPAAEILQSLDEPLADFLTLRASVLLYE